MQKKWQLYNSNPALSEQFSQELKISSITSQILINRGINNLKQAEEFINPKLSYLKDPFDIPNIKKAAERVLLAKERGEKILVYGDYDVDGVTGTAILLETLRFLGISASYYIPSRYGEGYSLNKDAIQKIKKDGADLIITVDCGISNLVEIELANSLGIEVIVTDHHNIPAYVLRTSAGRPENLPPAFAIVNPKLIPQQHPSRHLSGAGVAFKFAWVLLRSAGIKENNFLASLLDLTALGTIADVVPLTEENRILSVQGLSLLNERKRIGLKALMEAARIYKKISVKNVNFGLSPRINAAGRLEHASKSLELLLSKDSSEASRFAEELNKINIERQQIGSSIQEEVFTQLAEAPPDKLVVISGNNWHPGVIGIVASRVVDYFYRPAVLIGINEGVGRGSARSINDFNVFALLETCRDLYTDFGGHEGAAGFEIKPEKIPELVRRLNQEVHSRMKPEDLIPKIHIDAEVKPRQITMSLIKELEILDPHGEGNPAPAFVSKNLRLTDIRKVGAEGRHLKLKFKENGIALDVIGFSFGHLEDKLQIDSDYDIVYNLENNEWNGFESAQLSLIDLKRSNQ